MISLAGRKLRSGSRSYQFIHEPCYSQPALTHSSTPQLFSFSWMSHALTTLDPEDGDEDEDEDASLREVGISREKECLSLVPSKPCSVRYENVADRREHLLLLFLLRCLPNE